MLCLERGKGMRRKKAVFGDMRVIKRFLVLPKKINNEIRWLETAYIKQGYSGYEWVDCDWVDK